MRIGVRGLVAGALTLATLASGAGVAQAQGPVLENGKTKAVYDYKTAVRERVFIPQPGIDQDKNGQDDCVTADIIRPAESSATNKMPAIIDPSAVLHDGLPRHRGAVHGRLEQRRRQRPVAAVLRQLLRAARLRVHPLPGATARRYTDQGCPHARRPRRHRRRQVGRRLAQRPREGVLKAASRPTSEEVVASWHNGSSAMIGKSYDGTLSNGVAATGVEGLKTIVPGLGDFRLVQYSRTGGVRHNTNYPGEPQQHRHDAARARPTGVNLPERARLCDSAVRRRSATTPTSSTATVTRTATSTSSGATATTSRTPRKVKASVFITHGIQDDNVKMDQVGLWWDALKANGVEREAVAAARGPRGPVRVPPRRLGRHAAPLVRPLPLRRRQQHRRTSRRVTIENEKDVWGDYADWPIPGTQNVDVYLRSAGQANAGTLGGQAGAGATDALTFTATAQRDHADEQPVGLAGDPARVPLATAQERPAPLGHRPRRPRRRARRPGQQPERHARRLRPRHPGVPVQRRRHARHHRARAGARDRRRPVRGQGPRRRLHAARRTSRSRTRATSNPSSR